jgi:hypothetical protein
MVGNETLARFGGAPSVARKSHGQLVKQGVIAASVFYRFLNVMNPN